MTYFVPLPTSPVDGGGRRLAAPEALPGSGRRAPRRARTRKGAIFRVDVEARTIVGQPTADRAPAPTA